MNFRPSPRSFVFSFAILFITALSLASDFQSPRTAALGGAGHAAPLLTDSIYLNPSYVSFIPAYVFSTNYGFYRGDQQASGNYASHGHILNVAIQDGRNEFFQAGVGGTLKEDSKLLNVGASKSILKILGIGFGGKFIFPNPGNGDKARDGIFSTTVIAAKWLQAAVIVDNVFDGRAMKAQGLYREFILGTKFSIQNLAFVYLDPHYAPNIPNQPRFGYENGLELTPLQDIFLRLGMFRNSNIPELGNIRGRGYGFGLGWIAPRLSLDYGLKRTLEPYTNNTHNVGMTVYF